MTHQLKQFSRLSMVLLASLALIGCATQVVEKPTETMPASKPLKSFTRVILEDAQMRAPYAGQGANEKAARKIDELLSQRLKSVFGDSKVVAAEGITPGAGDLRVTPKIKQIKFIGGGARFFAGAMAGSSVIVMDLEFTDPASGATIAKTGTYRKGNAYAGGWSVGATDNIMLDNAVDDVVDFARSNY